MEFIQEVESVETAMAERAYDRTFDPTTDPRSAVIAAFSEARYYKAAERLHVGATILERTERGTIRTRAVVTRTFRCLDDAGNIHVEVVNDGKTQTWCYLRDAQVEYDGS